MITLERINDFRCIESERSLIQAWRENNARDVSGCQLSSHLIDLHQGGGLYTY